MQNGIGIKIKNSGLVAASGLAYQSGVDLETDGISICLSAAVTITMSG